MDILIKAKLLNKIINKLPPSQQEVLRMRYYSNMSFNEISENCNISINTALGRMRYALINLRKIIKKEGTGESPTYSSRLETKVQTDPTTETSSEPQPNSSNLEPEVQTAETLFGKLKDLTGGEYSSENVYVELPKVNLENISVAKLADQFHDFITSDKNLNLEIASEYLLIATWLTYLKSKLLLPESDEEEFKVLEVAEKLKLQLKKLELIRLLSDQMLKRKRLGREIFLRGVKGRIKSIYNSKYGLTLYELLKSYSSIVMKREFQRINIPKLPVLSTEDGIKRIKEFPGVWEMLIYPQ